jgi:uncharacterized protein
MKKILFFTFIPFIFFRVSAQQTLKYTQGSNSLLWEISGKNLKDPSYLFGTYHFAGSSFLDTLPAINQVFMQAKTVVGEIRMESELLVIAQLLPHMKMADNKLEDVLSASEYKLVDDYVIKISDGLNLNIFSSLKPAAVQLTLMKFTSPVKTAETEKLMDLYFQQEGEKLKKDIKGLETIAEQGKLLFGSPLKRQKKLLVKFVKQSDKQDKQAAELFNYYKAQDLENLERAIKEYSHYTGKEMSSLMRKRNEIWMKKLPGIMDEGTAFIAVGGGHLVGKYGLLSLLQNAGYVVRPVDTHQK